MKVECTPDEWAALTERQRDEALQQSVDDPSFDRFEQRIRTLLDKRLSQFEDRVRRKTVRDLKTDIVGLLAQERHPF